jgi:hypothetical protein
MKKPTKLKLAIVQSGLCQKWVAEAAEMDETVVSRIVTGRYNPTPLERIRLARVIQKPVGELFEDAADCQS